MTLDKNKHNEKKNGAGFFCEHTPTTSHLARYTLSYISSTDVSDRSLAAKPSLSSVSSRTNCAISKWYSSPAECT